MKNTFGVTYSAFDGLELLPYSIESVIDSVDYINIIFQEKSFFGNPASSKDCEILKNIESKYEGIEVLYYNTPSRYSKDYSGTEINHAKRQESEKRSKGLNAALSHGVNYWMSMDVDEFYVKEELEWAKSEILKHGYHKTACKITDYHNLPIYRLDKLEEEGRFNVPFFHFVNQYSKVGYGFSGYRADPTRGIHTPNKDRTCIFDPQKITMHHMKTVRTNLYSKFKNTSRLNLDRDRINEKVRNIQSYHPEQVSNPKGTVVENQFNIDLNQFK